jgi:beta-lactam-binding protein with PASTA domain
VISGSPTALGTYGVTVAVTDSSNPSITATFNYTWSIAIQVPYLIGFSSSEASAVLRNAGLVPRNGGNIPLDDRDLSGKVAVQRPNPGTLVAQGTVVDLIVGYYASNQCGPNPC